MRLIIGVVIALIVLTGATLTVLALWGVQPISWAIVWKSGLTIAIIGAASLIISLVYFFFLKKDPFNMKKDK